MALAGVPPSHPAERLPFIESIWWAILESGAIATRPPLRRARMEKSTSAASGGALGSKPPSCLYFSRFTSAPAVPTAMTSSRWSCWPWSNSPRTRLNNLPPRVRVSPICLISFGSSQSTCLGPTTAKEGLSSTSLRSFSRASASGALSSCKIHR